MSPQGVRLYEAYKRAIVPRLLEKAGHPTGNYMMWRREGWGALRIQRVRKERVTTATQEMYL
jgi:hypothetical protein